MEYKNYISKIVSSILLAVYLFSIMPRVVLHNIAANHNDVFVIQERDSKESIGENTIHCQLQDQVCTEPGLPEYIYYLVKQHSFFIDYETVLLKASYPSPILSKPLRGPPVIA